MERRGSPAHRARDNESGGCHAAPHCLVTSYIVLPVLPPGSRAAVRGLSPQVRGGRYRSSAARAECPACNGLQCVVAWLARKRVDDVLPVPPEHLDPVHRLQRKTTATAE